MSQRGGSIGEAHRHCRVEDTKMRTTGARPFVEDYVGGPSPSSSRPLAATPTRVEDEGYCLPPFSSSNPGDAEILRHLLRLLERYHSVGHNGVNAGLPLWDPWNIPGMPLDEEEANRREKYYVTDCSVLKSSCTNPATQTGYRKPRDLGWGIPGESIGPAQVTGLKTTYDFHIGETIYQEGSKGTSWIMDVYSLIENGQVEGMQIVYMRIRG
ncbi:unnamed protein product [Miscanthus lutarioriparius]|uniref:NAC domain-containing protein n=1 Tax=Miscanthus lutarioriparius TaxID=422564 RepID=A0A811RGU5_9POAL|nr:unnamed protein product [Miscanthus lutarioriparius]